MEDGLNDIELVAEFMGKHIIGTEGEVYYECDENGYIDYVSDPVPYWPDRDWNQLVDILRKIDKLEILEEIYQLHLEQINSDIYHAFIDLNIEECFKYCIEFIKEYNKN